MAPRLEGLFRSMTAVAEWSELTLPLSNLENCIMARLQTPRYWNFDHASESRIHIDANDIVVLHTTPRPAVGSAVSPPVSVLEKYL